MNFSMMYKRAKNLSLRIKSLSLRSKDLWAGAVFLLAVCLGISMRAGAAAGSAVLPEGQVLLIYADDADAKAREAVQFMVETFTFLDVKVTFGTAAECVGQLERFSHVICYQLFQPPAELTSELLKIERKGKLLFIGSEFLQRYLMATGRGSWLAAAEGTSGKCTYSFAGGKRKQELVQEEFFGFLETGWEERAGGITVGHQEGYFRASVGGLSHIPVTDAGGALVKGALTEELAQWSGAGGQGTTTASQYYVFNHIYPFQDPELLLQAADVLIQQNKPFVMTVMPVYQHGDYPAMQRFCEVLRYVQAHDGAVVLHTPLHQMSQLDVTRTNEYLAAAMRNYLANGVYPVGIQVPRNWLLNPNTREILTRFRTVLVEEEGEPYPIVDWASHSNLIQQDGHQWIPATVALDAYGTSYTSAYPTAVYLDITWDQSRLETRLADLKSSDIPVRSLWDLDHSLWTDGDILTYQNRTLLLNQEEAALEFQVQAMEEAEAYEYRRDVLHRFSADLTNENQNLLIAVFGVSVLFVIFIILARRNNRSRFFLRPDGGTYGEEYLEDFLADLEEDLEEDTDEDWGAEADLEEDWEEDTEADWEEGTDEDLEEDWEEDTDEDLEEDWEEDTDEDLDEDWEEDTEADWEDTPPDQPGGGAV